MTCRWVINTPPHLFLVKSPSHVASLTNTCHGHSPNVEPVPPTIRPLFLTKGRTPHAKSVHTKQNKSQINCENRAFYNTLWYYFIFGNMVITRYAKENLLLSVAKTIIILYYPSGLPMCCVVLSGPLHIVAESKPLKSLLCPKRVILFNFLCEKFNMWTLILVTLAMQKVGATEGFLKKIP